MKDLFKEHEIGKSCLFDWFYLAVDVEKIPIDMVRFYTGLKKNNCLGYKDKDFSKLFKKVGIVSYDFAYLKLRGALEVFKEVSKTKRFRSELVKGLRKSMDNYAKIKGMDPKDLKCGWINMKTGKAAFSPKENMQSQITNRLQEIHGAIEFLKGNVPKDLLDRARGLGI